MSALTERILSVSALTRMIKDTLGETFPAVWVKGEVTGLRRSPPGHVYFSLKEGMEAILECAMFSRAASRLGFELRDGAEVEAFGSVSVFEPRGRYQNAKPSWPFNGSGWTWKTPGRGFISHEWLRATRNVSMP